VSEYYRRSARILVIDADERVLLLLSAPNEIEPEPCWITPGGGVGPGESLVEAAVREAREEIGLTVTQADLGRVVAWGAGRVAAWPDTGVFRDDYFHVRVSGHDVDTSAMEEFEAGFHRGHRWWTVDDLAASTERVIPFGLAALVTDLVAGRAPAEPVRLPWHHA
jgi:8-oxo-dGTP pyrophosphatase MutT (NUDIX family)